MLAKERETKKDEDEFVSLSLAFKEAQDKNTNVSNINIKDIFKS